MKKLLTLVLFLVLASSLALANGLNLNGFGARAAAMGGAFVGLADDFSAVFWNPAGLAFQGDATFGLAGDAIIPKAEYDFLGFFDMKSKSKMYPAALAGYFKRVNEKLVLGLGVYTPSGLGAAWNSAGYEDALMAVGYPGAVVVNDAVDDYRWESFIGAITLAPTVAVKLSDAVSIGASLNVNYGFFKLWQWGGLYQVGPGYYVNLGQQTLNLKGWGFGGTFGILIKPSDMFSIGATLRTPSKVKLSGTTEIENLTDLELPGNTSDTNMDVTYPMWIAVGVAFKPMENLTITADAQYTNWEKLQVLALDFVDPIWQAALPPEEAQLELLWSDKIQWRFGLEYVIGNLALRGGYYYDPTPTPDETLTILVPGYDFNNITFGFGYNAGNFKLDVGFEYLMGKTREIGIGVGSQPGTFKMNIMVPQISLRYDW
jgi:long-chain fatty acid transport protein